MVNYALFILKVFDDKDHHNTVANYLKFKQFLNTSNESM